MQNETLNVLDKHCSVRHFKDEKIEPKVLDEILKSATRAASSGNMQFYAMVVTQDFSQRQKLHAVHEEQAMILQAPVLLTFCADLNRLDLWMKKNNAQTGFNNELSLMRGVIDASLVAQNAVIAAESLGLGTCYMGTTLTAVKDIASILNLPRLVVPVTTLCLGYPKDPLRMQKIERLPMAAVVHQEHYQNFDDQKIDKIYEQREKDYWQRFQNNPKRKAVTDRDDVENIAQAYRELKFKPEELESHSKELWDFYQEQFLQLKKDT